MVEEEDVCLSSFESLIYQPICDTMTSKNITKLPAEPITLNDLLTRLNIPFEDLMKCNSLDLTASDGTKILMLPHDVNYNTLYMVVIGGVVFLIYVCCMAIKDCKDRNERVSIRASQKVKEDDDRKERVELKKLILEMANNGKVNGTECAQILQAAFSIKVDDVVVMNDGSPPSSIGCVSTKSI